MLEMVMVGNLLAVSASATPIAGAVVVRILLAFVPGQMPQLRQARLAAAS